MMTRRDDWRPRVTDLLTKAQAGDMDAFAALFEPLRPKIMAVACHLVGPVDAEDVTMDTFLKAWDALPRFRGLASPATWLIRIARNQALDVLRRRSGALGSAISMDDLEPGQEPGWADPTASSASEQAVLADDYRICLAALQRLDPRHREILLLRYRDEMEYAEMAAALGISIGTVMSRLYHARRNLVRHASELADTPAAVSPGGKEGIA